ncbi:hypothetical protein LIHA111178_11305 [Litorimonas haliclonae]
MDLLFIPERQNSMKTHEKTFPSRITLLQRFPNFIL